MSDQTLTSRQQAVLKLIGSEPDLAGQFYLSGGTALAAFYLKHRYSEDLDFFSEVELDTTALTAFWQKHKAGLGFEEIDYQQSFNRNLFFPESLRKIQILGSFFHILFFNSFNLSRVETFNFHSSFSLNSYFLERS